MLALQESEMAKHVLMVVNGRDHFTICQNLGGWGFPRPPADSLMPSAGTSQARFAQTSRNTQLDAVARALAGHSKITGRSFLGFSSTKDGLLAR